MSNSYQLKSHPPDRLLRDHLIHVSSSCKRIIQETTNVISTSISLSDLTQVAFIIGATHDIGKGTPYFQKYLLDKEAKIDPFLKSHSMISSLYCSWLILNDTTISDISRNYLCLAASLVIQGHHGSLKRPTSYLENLEHFNKEEIFSKQIESLNESLQELERITTHDLGLDSFVEFTNSWQDHLYDFCRNIILLGPPSYSKEQYFTINLLYSALLEADVSHAGSIIQSPRLDIESDIIRNYIADIQTNDDAKEINLLRNILFNHVDNKSVTEILDHKIFTLTAPTGLGKTLTSMNFALNVRRRIQQEKAFRPRIVYVAPFISILDQNMEVLQKVFTQPQEAAVNSNLLLMHHHLAPVNYKAQQQDETYSTSQSEFLTHGWNAEIVVTTFIQFFNTIFGRYTSQLRRLNNLVGSIIILDEVQSIPFKFWDAVRNVLLFLSTRFNFTVILMTATKPLIFAEGETTEIASNESIQNIPARVSFQLRHRQEITLDNFCNEINHLIGDNNDKNILIELNTINTAKQVLDSISSDNLFFLSSQVIPKHRRPRINKIKEALKPNNNKPVILVTTQVIEAGVDVDFDIAVRDIGPIDSIVQTAGRCNRNGKRSAIESPFFIYRIMDDRRQFVTEYAKYVYGDVSIEIAKSLLDKDNLDISSLVNDYFLEIQNRRSNQESKKLNMDISKLNYEEVEQGFRLIDEEYKMPVFVEFDDNAKTIWERFVKLAEDKNRKRTSESIQLRNEMEQYMIGVSEKDVQNVNLKESSGIYKINNSDIGRLYNEETGFVSLS
jgi:CRISPR-associated endonuclease/helicase Cas3